MSLTYMYNIHRYKALGDFKMTIRLFCTHFSIAVVLCHLVNMPLLGGTEVHQKQNTHSRGNRLFCRLLSDCGRWKRLIGEHNNDS